ncbi:hypothetical protein HID58_042713 [Brassica napus]|uniref:Uncharacterized protein n=1 Tax=Brassica napus TaxID=3708 RepID=A0ABQ8BEI4_BRANA|nr:hypothetical protein HID58_042713 [Brassica napus]
MATMQHYEASWLPRSGDCVLSSPFVFSNTTDLSSEEKKTSERDERLHEEEEDTGGKIKDRSEFVTVVTSRERLSPLQPNSNPAVPRTTTHHRSKTTMRSLSDNDYNEMVVVVYGEKTDISNWNHIHDKKQILSDVEEITLEGRQMRQREDICD